MRALLVLAIVVAPAVAGAGVVFHGNHAIATAELDELARQRAPTSQDELVELAGDVQLVYFDRGYADAVANVAPDKSIHIVEGKRYKFGKISAAGLPAGVVRAKTGEYFTHAIVVADVQRLSDAAKAPVTSEVHVDSKARTIDVSYAVQRTLSK